LEDNSPVHDKAAPINRFLFSCLQRVDAAECLRYSVGRYTSNDDGTSWQVEAVPSSDKQELISSRTAGGATLVLRTGPESALERFSAEIKDWAEIHLRPDSKFDFFLSYFGASKSLAIFDEPSLLHFSPPQNGGVWNLFNVNVSMDEWFEHNLFVHLAVQDGITHANRLIKLQERLT
jgi:hypothetical protein